MLREFSETVLRQVRHRHLSRRVVLARGHEPARRHAPHGERLKADLTVAKLALSADIGRAAARLTGWSGARLGQDTIWWKAPKTKAVALHQDTSFLDYLDPPQTITCWVTLDDTHRDVGTLEYVPGSHRWPLTPIPEGFHAPDDYRALMKNAARMASMLIRNRTLSKYRRARACCTLERFGTARRRTARAIACADRSASI